MTDLKGPISVAGQKGERYFQLYTEEKTKFRTVKFLVTKDETLATTTKYIEKDLASEQND